MRFESVKEPKGKALQRLDPVQRRTLAAMAAVLFVAILKQKEAFGTPDTFPIEDRLTKMLCCWRG